MRLKKRERQSQLQTVLDADPFLTDGELADKFAVSVQTIRLDRMELGIPELRERVKMVAHQAYTQVRSLGQQELMGELWELELGIKGTSVLDTTMDMVFEKTKIVRGHYIFAQANSLAVALVDANVALTATANLKFIRPVYPGERLICTATVMSQQGNQVNIAAETLSSNQPIFRGDFTVAITEMEGEG